MNFAKQSKCFKSKTMSVYKQHEVDKKYAYVCKVYSTTKYFIKL